MDCKLNRSWNIYLFALIAAVECLNSSAPAAEPFRWRFEVGEKLHYNITQDLAMTINAGQGGPIATSFQQRLQLTWEVQSVDGNGDASIRQTVDRIKLQINGPGYTAQYDSSSDDPPEGLAAMIAPMFDAMTAEAFELTMTDRGEIRDVKVPENVLEAIKGIPGVAAMGDMTTSEGFQRMLMQAALVLPDEPPTVGESWSTTNEMDSPTPGGKVNVETTYTYEGTRDVDGVTMAVFRPTLTMGFAGENSAQMRVVEERTDGEMLFNQAAGRLDSIHMQQMTKLEMTIGDQKIEQQIDQLIEAVVTPVEASAEEVDAVSSGATTE
jgi:hypothetical protein